MDYNPPEVHRKLAMHKFNMAVATNVLSADKDADNWAGHFMYMHSEGDKDYFKDIITRDYVVCNVMTGKIIKSNLHCHASRVEQ